jgi:cell division inhibitor SepF
MGAMRKMAVYLGLVEDDALEYAEHDDYVEPRPRYEEPRYSSVREVRPEPRAEARPEPRATTRSTEVPARSSRSASVAATALAVEPVAETRHDHDLEPASSDFYRITTLHPRTYNDARRIGEEFRQGVPVIMNLTEMDDTDAKRIVDFAAGLVFGCRGTIERVTNKVFLLSPINVDVAAEARRLAQDGFFNQS